MTESIENCDQENQSEDSEQAPAIAQTSCIALASATAAVSKKRFGFAAWNERAFNDGQDLVGGCLNCEIGLPIFESRNQRLIENLLRLSVGEQWLKPIAHFDSRPVFVPVERKECAVVFGFSADLPGLENTSRVIDEVFVIERAKDGKDDLFAGDSVVFREQPGETVFGPLAQCARLIQDIARRRGRNLLCSYLAIRRPGPRRC